MHFSRIFKHVGHPLYICKQNLQASMDKEDFGHISRFIQFNQIADCAYNKIANNNLVDGFYTIFRANKSGKKLD